MSIDKYLLIQAFGHPAMQAQDLLKLCYQAAYGAEHLLEDEAAAFAMLKSEWERTPENSGQLLEPVCDEYSRVDIGACKKAGLAPEDLFEAFLLTAGEPRDRRAQDALFEQYLNSAEQFCTAGMLSFGPEQWNAFMVEYKAAGGGPVHHSPAYRQEEKPAYRLIDRKYEAFLEQKLIQRAAEYNRSAGQ